jgi:hypothetical protein
MNDKRTDAELDPAEHIDADDPRYDGFRIRELWAATAVATDNQEATLWVDLEDANAYHLTQGPAMAADERRLRHLREFAQAIATRYGVEVRIRHFCPAGDDAEVIAP